MRPLDFCSVYPPHTYFIVFLFHHCHYHIIMIIHTWHVHNKAWHKTRFSVSLFFLQKSSVVYPCENTRIYPKVSIFRRYSCFFCLFLFSFSFFFSWLVLCGTKNNFKSPLSIANRNDILDIRQLRFSWYWLK